MQVLFNKLVSKQILCVEKSVHVQIDEINSFNENDAQDKEFELALARKDLVLMHEGKCSEKGSGPTTVSMKGGQGLEQIGGSTAKPCLEQNQPNGQKYASRTGAETCSRTGAETGS